MSKKSADNVKPPLFDPKLDMRQKVVRFFIHLFAWVGLAALLYVGFSFFFDTPLEYKMKHSTAELRRQYDSLNVRYDSVNMALENVMERDRNVFKILFEAEPYDLEGDYSARRWITYEKLLAKERDELGRELSDKTVALEKKMKELLTTYVSLGRKMDEMGDRADFIPSIQPVINDQLTLLTASYGLRIHPFYKTLMSHQGVDYTVPEGSRVFATADGRVKDVIRSNSTSGLTITISHGDDGYETQYSHLSQSNVRKGGSVKRGDIIALTGNTGLSLSPHLHYEVRHHGMRVDPIHYFFMELSPFDYQRISQIARSGMQSFD